MATPQVRSMKWRKSEKVREIKILTNGDKSHSLDSKWKRSIGFLCQYFHLDFVSKMSYIIYISYMYMWAMCVFLYFFYFEIYSHCCKYFTLLFFVWPWAATTSWTQFLRSIHRPLRFILCWWIGIFHTVVSFCHLN